MKKKHYRLKISPTMICWEKNDKKTVNQWIIDGKIKRKGSFEKPQDQK
jgi:hypothetical protein